MCIFCKCDTTKESTTTHVVNYKGCVIVIKNVPCEECEQCGEKFYTDDVAERLEDMEKKYKNYVFHAKGACIGTILGEIAALLSGCIVQLISRI